MQQALLEILRAAYGLEPAELRFLREGGGQTYVAEGPERFFVKVIGTAFAATARQSVLIMRYLEEGGFPVPKTLLTRSGEAALDAAIGGEDRLIVVQEYVEGEEPDLSARAEDVGALTGRLHALLEGYPGALVARGRPFFIERYLDILRRKEYPRLAEYAALGDALWRQVEDLPVGNCHGDLHRGNLLETPGGKIYLLDFDTVCRAPTMFDVAVMCDMTDYFRLKPEDIDLAASVYEQFLSGYSRHRALTPAERRSFAVWVAIRHFQLQATIVELYGIDCIDGNFIDSQLDWLERWLRAAGERAAIL